MTKQEEYREELWCEVLVACIRSDNCIDMSSALSWADKAVEQYDKRFSPEALEKVREKEAAKRPAAKASYVEELLSS